MFVDMVSHFLCTDLMKDDDILQTDKICIQPG